MNNKIFHQLPYRKLRGIVILASASTCMFMLITTMWASARGSHVSPTPMPSAAIAHTSDAVAIVVTSLPTHTAAPTPIADALPSPTTITTTPQPTATPNQEVQQPTTLESTPTPISTALTTTSVASSIARTAFVWQDGNLRAGPGTKAAIIGSIRAGDVVQILAQQDGWLQINATAGEGWSSKSLLIIDGDDAAAPDQPAAPATTPTPVASDAVQDTIALSVLATETTTPVGQLATLWNGGNVRQGPGMSYPVIGNLDAGDEVTLFGVAGQWWHLRAKTFDGWVHESIITIPASTLKLWLPNPAPTPIPAKPTTAQLAVARASAPSVYSPGTTRQSVVAPTQLNKLPAIIAPRPYLVPQAQQAFLQARAQVLAASGVDYLGRLDDAFRGIDFETNKAGVSRFSWHKAGRAVDLSSSFAVNGVQGVLFARDAQSPRLYRTLIRCARQDGSLGAYYSPAIIGRSRAGYYVDVTQIMTSAGFQRIPPVDGVSEAWHYEIHGGLTWAQAMQQLYSVPTLRRYYPEIWR